MCVYVSYKVINSGCGSNNVVPHIAACTQKTSVDESGTIFFLLLVVGATTRRVCFRFSTPNVVV